VEKEVPICKGAGILFHDFLKESTGIRRIIQIFRAEQKEPLKLLYFYFGRLFRDECRGHQLRMAVLAASPSTTRTFIYYPVMFLWDLGYDFSSRIRIF
jgi:hypothetical protein